MQYYVKPAIIRACAMHIVHTHTHTHTHTAHAQSSLFVFHFLIFLNASNVPIYYVFYYYSTYLENYSTIASKNPKVFNFFFFLLC